MSFSSCLASPIQVCGRFWYILCASFIFSSCAIEAKALPDKIQKIMQQKKYQHANWGILVKDVVTQEVLYELNSNQLFLPGSTLKIFTTAALLQIYGEN